ncbi:MAG: hypothetical protein Q8J69_03485 [Sphingobacteriaceae bacterium]|nr:hypothetical protein [Sphingobacteriaceae bacterium]
MLFTFQRRKILYLAISLIVFASCAFEQRSQEPRIAIVYNVDNCLECNRYVPNMIEQLMPKNPQRLTLYIKKTRKIEAESIRKRLGLPKNTSIVSDNDSLAMIKSTLPKDLTLDELGWSSTLIIQDQRKTTYSRLDASKPM